MSAWPITIKSDHGGWLEINKFGRLVTITVDSAPLATVTMITPAQSATLRAALEAAEQEMS